MVEKQNGLCKICNRPFDGVFYIDHCHSTGFVRGLLCRTCNCGLGLFGDSVELLHSAADYVRRARAEADLMELAKFGPQRPEPPKPDGS